MKSLNLYVIGEGWKAFEYSELSDLKDEFLKRGITIGNKASIGDEASIGNNASIGDALKIKTISISGSRHHVSYYGMDIIHIGCVKKKHFGLDW